MIAILTNVTFDPNRLPNYALYTNAIKEKYCSIYKDCEFIFKAGIDGSLKQNNHYMFKFDGCEELIKSGKYSWVVIMDLDAAPCNFNVDFAAWLESKEKKIIVAKDIAGKTINDINAGIAAFPCIEKSLAFIARMRELADTDKFNWDQSIIKHLIKTEYRDFWQSPEKEFGFNNSFISNKVKNMENIFIPGKSFALHALGPRVYGFNRNKIFREMWMNLNDAKSRTLIGIGGRMGNLLYGILNNWIASKNDKKNYVYIQPRRQRRNAIDKQIVNEMNLYNIYIPNYDGEMDDKEINFVKENKTLIYGGFGIDFQEDQLNDFIENTFLKSKAFKDLQLINDRVSIHIRGTDYLHKNNFKHYKFNFGKFLDISLNYFKNKGLKDLDVYSDDFKYTKLFTKIFVKHGFKVIFKERKSVLDTFKELSIYRNKIIWNSTFSYWTAYISNAIFKDNFKDIFVPEHHASHIYEGKAWQLNPKWSIVKNIS